MQTRGVIGHYVFVSSKTRAGIDELQTAIFDCDIDNGNRELEPSERMDPIKKVSKARRRIERRKIRQALQKQPMMRAAKTFTAGFGPKGELLDKFGLGDVMNDGAESGADPEENKEELEMEVDSDDDVKMKV